MNVDITVTVNGKTLAASVNPGASLLDFLRAEGLTGVKQGCGVGECGACTVLVDSVAVDSCLFLAVWADGKAVRTKPELGLAGLNETEVISGIADGQLVATQVVLPSSGKKPDPQQQAGGRPGGPPGGGGGSGPPRGR